MTIQMAIDVIPCSLLNVAAVIDVIDAISHNHSILSGWKKKKRKEKQFDRKNIEWKGWYIRMRWKKKQK